MLFYICLDWRKVQIICALYFGVSIKVSYHKPSLVHMDIRKKTFTKNGRCFLCHFNELVVAIDQATRLTRWLESSKELIMRVISFSVCSAKFAWFWWSHQWPITSASIYCISKGNRFSDKANRSLTQFYSIFKGMRCWNCRPRRNFTLSCPVVAYSTVIWLQP